MKSVSLLLLISFGLFSETLFANERVTLEVGAVKNTFNSVKIPGDDGTRFNMRKSFPQDAPYFRLDYKKIFDNGYGLRLLYAPLKLSGEHRYSKNIDFDGATFAQDVKSKNSFQFNSYRFSYFYQWFNTEKFKLKVGITGKIRDANIKFKQGSRQKNRYDLVFVPLFYLWSEYWLNESMKLTFDFDGLAAPQGRAFDIALMLGHKLSSSVTANLGYRMLEGGADNDKVYTFSQFNYYFAAVEISF